MEDVDPRCSRSSRSRSSRSARSGSRSAGGGRACSAACSCSRLHIFTGVIWAVPWVVLDEDGSVHAWHLALPRDVHRRVRRDRVPARDRRGPALDRGLRARGSASRWWPPSNRCPPVATERPLVTAALLLVVPSLRTIPWSRPLLVAVVLGSFALAAARCIRAAAARCGPRDRRRAPRGLVRARCSATAPRPSPTERRRTCSSGGRSASPSGCRSSSSCGSQRSSSRAEGPYAVTLSFLFGAEILRGGRDRRRRPPRRRPRTRGALGRRRASSWCSSRSRSASVST